MNNKKILVYLFLAMTLTSCDEDSFWYKIFSQPIDKEFTYRDHYIDFNDVDETNLYSLKNNYSNGGMFISVWKKDNVKIENGFANVTMYDKDGVNYGAEFATHQGYLYGYFSTRMKPFKRSGTVQSFFTYNKGPKGHDEIDIEFLGKDTTHVQFNYYSDGVGGHEKWYDLGFDASEEFHDYGFIWEKDEITWFVDYVPVHHVKASLDQWGFTFFNVWAGNNSDAGIKKWLGEFKSSEEKFVCQYDYIIAKEDDFSD